MGSVTSDREVPQEVRSERTATVMSSFVVDGHYASAHCNVPTIRRRHKRPLSTVVRIRSLRDTFHARRPVQFALDK